MNSEIQTHPLSLTEQYDGWIKKIARRMFNKFRGFYTYDELLSVAYLASVEAERTYDAKRAKFSAYIKPRIEGAIIRSVSNVSNTQHTTLQEIYKFIDSYLDKHNRIPAQHIILQHVGITEARFLALLDATIQITQISTDDIIDQESEDMDLDTIAEYQRMMEVISTLDRHQRERVAEFLDDPNVDPTKIEDITQRIRNNLGIV